MPHVAKVIAISARKTCRTRRCFWTKSNMKGGDSTSRGASGRAASGRKVEYQHLRGASRFQAELAALGLERVPGGERLPVRLKAATCHMYVALAIGRERELGPF